MSTNDTLSIDKVSILETCAQIEERNAELYYLFAEQAAGNVVLQKMWQQTALEEEEHARQIRLASRLRDAVEDVSMDRWVAENMLQVVISIIENARRSLPAPADTLRVANKLEEKLSAFHLDCIAHFKDESFTKLFQTMHIADQAHIKRLQDAYQKSLERKI